MRYLHNVVYLLLLCLGSPWLLTAAWRHGKYRNGLPQKLFGFVPRLPAHRARVWFHAVSVGEVNMLAPLLQRLRTQRPDVECLISTTTRTGYELAKNKYADHLVIYCPLDFSWAVRTSLRRLRPSLLVLVELELWPNLLAEARRLRVPVAIVNGRISDKSWRGYRRLRPVIRRWLRGVRCVAAQSAQCSERFAAIGVPADRVRHVGSAKFDGAMTDRQNVRTQKLAKLAGLREEAVVFLAGSTQAPEEQLAIETFQQLRDEFPELYLIIVPRHPERFDEVAILLDRSMLPWRRRSTLAQGQPTASRTLLVDCVGELGAWWGRAEIGFVGGSMGSRGGQNMLEPAGLGVATSFGPHTRNFRDIVDLLVRRDASVVVENGPEMTQFVRKCLQDSKYRRQLGGRARQLVEEQAGAADQTVNMLLDLLPSVDVGVSQRVGNSTVIGDAIRHVA